MHFFLIYIVSVIFLTFYLKKKKLFSNYTGEHHQLFSNQKNIPLVGGIFLLIPIILIDYLNIIYIIAIFLTFLLGFLSDQKNINIC